jgi:MFS family permease
MNHRCLAVPKVLKKDHGKGAAEFEHTVRHRGDGRVPAALGEASAAMINFFSGMAGMIAFVATLTLAADYCPQRSEGFAFAALMSITNFSAALSDNLGSFLYEHLFHRQLQPLILVSAAFTAFAFAFVPLLQLGDKQPGEPAPQARAGQ